MKTRATKEWKKLLRTDKSKFNLFGSDGRDCICRLKDIRMDPWYQYLTMKHENRSVMVCGAFYHDGVTPLIRINGIMDHNAYKSFLEIHTPLNSQKSFMERCFNRIINPRTPPKLWQNGINSYKNWSFELAE